MMFAAAILSGLALGALVPWDRSAGVTTIVVRVAAGLVLVVAATIAWPIISPDDIAPASAFGFSATAAALIAVYLERRADALALAQHEREYEVESR
ncbi:hypothetical protein [Agrococcus citreus]